LYSSKVLLMDEDVFNKIAFACYQTVEVIEQNELIV
jgi:hypothetical protein